jgi:SAM-dependent methyltransferase
MRVRDVIPLWRVDRAVKQYRARRFRLFTPAMLRLNKGIAQRIGVEAACHPGDLIYQYVVQQPLFPGLESAVFFYFQDGLRSSNKLSNIFYQLKLQKPVRLLEFASGYGCVTRHLKRLPGIQLVACDIHEEATGFLKDSLGVRSVLSTHQPEDLRLSESFDVVFALSFFSHMPERSFGRWIKALFAPLAPGGYLIFTTHGLANLEILGKPEIPPSGIWFVPASEQHDLDQAEYGTSIVTPEFVRREVLRETGEEIFEFRYADWWEHQDLWIVRKSLAGL